MDQVHMLLSADHDEQNFVRLGHHDIAVLKVVHLLGGRAVKRLIVRRLMVNWLVKVVHAEQCESDFFVVFNVLLGQEVLVCQELIFIFVICFVQLVIIVKVLREYDIESSVILVVLNELVAFNQ
jgi:hypothetical protein